MARYYGNIGYASLQETTPGVWTEVITERKYYGDVVRNTRRLEGSDNLNDNIVLSNSFSVMADAYAYDHFFNIRYLEWSGERWRVTSVDVQRPRLILNIGGIYNGE